MKDSRGIMSVDDLEDLHKKGRLDLKPVFQRKSIWGDEARCGLIDTIYRGYPVPEIFLWDTNEDKKGSYAVIDGQQRLNAILDFLNGKGIDKKKNPYFEIKYSPKSRIKIHADLRGNAYADLVAKQQRRIDDYKVHIRYIESDELEEIDNLFQRLNTNVYETNRQELRNLIRGDMQKLAGSLTKEFKDFLTKSGIISPSQELRQKDTSHIINEMLLCAEKGEITGSNDKIKDDLYRTNVKFPRKGAVRNSINKTQNIIEKILPMEHFEASMFTKDNNYLALFTTLYLAITGGWTDSKHQMVKFTVPSEKKKRDELRDALIKFSSEVTEVIPALLDRKTKLASGKPVKDISDEVRDYAKAVNKSHTTDPAIRKRKCIALLNTIWNHLQQVDTGKGPTAEDRKWLWATWHERSDDGKPICVTCKEEISKIGDMDVGHKEKRHLGGANERSNYHPQHVECNRRDNQPY